ncbi:hypothetical protein [uncultured Mycolicibacterium sp.]|uniref:hypothetical protein n=1 Tax=uncultured Mycolicibacterium sp. TaxID=2320817 RepID=UPI00261F17C4|nr:hypothetical protein [uncultured Mycolicibacterium sp.]
MTLKSLVTGLATATVVGGAAAGAIAIAAPVATAPAVAPVVWDIPLPTAPAPELEAPLQQTLQALAGGGSFAGKGNYIEGGLGRFESMTADRAFRNAAAEGLLPLSFTVADIDVNGPIATANVTATAANGKTATTPLTFVAGPSPTGWLLSKASALALLTAVG